MKRLQFKFFAIATLLFWLLLISNPCSSAKYVEFQYEKSHTSLKDSIQMTSAKDSSLTVQYKTLLEQQKQALKEQNEHLNTTRIIVYSFLVIFLLIVVLCIVIAIKYYRLKRIQKIMK